MLWLISTVLLALHLVAVDLAMAAPLACVWLGWRAAKRSDCLARQLKPRLAMYSIVALVIALLLGVVQLGIVRLSGDRHFWQAAGTVPASRWWFGVGELAFFLLCMVVYLYLERRAPRPILQAILAILAATDLLYHFPPLFAMLNLMVDRPELVGHDLDNRLFRRLLIDPEVLTMVLHVWLAAVAVTAVTIMHGALRCYTATPEATRPPPLVPAAAGWALGATLCQMAVGVGVLLTLGPSGRDALLGDDILGTSSFILGIAVALVLLHHLAAIAFGDSDARQVGRSVALILATTLLMTATLSRTRLANRIDVSAQPATHRQSVALSDRFAGTSDISRVSAEYLYPYASFTRLSPADEPCALGIGTGNREIAVLH